MNEEQTKRFAPESPQETLPVVAEKPWYKNRILWVCLAIPLWSLIMGGITLAVALQSSKSTVLEGYYKEGFAPKQVAKSALAQGLRAELIDGALVLTDEKGVVGQQELILKLEHPTLEAQDQSFTLKGTAGRYPLNPAVLELLKKQHWYLRLYDRSQTWQIKGEAHPFKTGVVLLP